MPTGLFESQISEIWLFQTHLAFKILKFLYCLAYFFQGRYLLFGFSFFKTYLLFGFSEGKFGFLFMRRVGKTVPLLLASPKVMPAKKEEEELWAPRNGGLESIIAFGEVGDVEGGYGFRFSSLCFCLADKAATMKSHTSQRTILLRTCITGQLGHK